MNVEEIFLAAVAKKTPAERTAYLDGVCGSNAELHAKVVALLRSHEQAGSFLHGPLFAPTIDTPAVVERPGSRIGPYKLLQQIGQGGMGTVFMAEQIEPVQRKVALKVIKAGMDSQHVIARFEAERQALALMDHPNIARVLDADTTESGRPYFVMELVKGVPITRYCDEHHLAPRERLELFVPVCQAVQHAHQKGIIHRDLKPSNVLIALYDGKAVPKVIDFGVAKATGPKLTERTLFTEFGAVVGTLEYMSPEQAELNQLDVDTRSDIYSLGVLLYELLTGTTPLERKRLNKSALIEALRLIREEEPPRPSTRLSTGEGLPAIAANRGLEPKKLSGLVRGELDWIAMKALEKDRNRRYETANGLASDVKRYLADEPVQACPPSAGYRLRKFLRKHRAQVGTAGALLTLLLVAMAVTTWKWREAIAAQEATDEALGQVTVSHGATEKALAHAHDQKALADDRLVHMQVAAGVKLMDEGDVLGAFPWFVKALAEEQGGLDRQRIHRLRLDTVLFDCPRLVQLLVHNGRVGDVEFSPDGGRIVTAGGNGAALWDATTGERIGPRLAHSGPVFRAKFSPDGRHVVTAGADQTRKGVPAGGHSRVWDAATGQALTLPLKHSAPVHHAAFSPDGKRVVTASDDQTAQVWNAVTGLPVTGPLKHPTQVVYAAFSPDGSRIVTSCRDRRGGFSTGAIGGLQVWDAVTGKPITALLYSRELIREATFSADGRWIVASSENMGVRLLDATTGLPVLPPLKTQPWRAALSRDGRRIVTACRDQTARVWDARTGKPVTPPLTHHGEVLYAEFSPDGRYVVTASQDQTARLWDAVSGRPISPPLRHGAVVDKAVFSPDGRRVVTASRDHLARVWDIAPRQGVIGSLWLRSGYWWVSPDCRRIVTAEGNNTALVWDVGTGQTVGEPMKHSANVSNTVFSRDGGRIITVSRDHTTRVWDVATGKPVTPTMKHSNEVSHAAFSPDGLRIATGCRDGTLRVWNAITGESVTPPFENSGVNHVAFSPEGRRIVAAGAGVRVWDAVTGKPVTPMLRLAGFCLYAEFSPDGRWVVASVNDQGAQVYDVTTGEPVSPLLKHGERVVYASFSPDGKRVVTASHDQTARVWDAATGVPLTSPLKHSGPISRAGFSRDGSWIITRGWHGGRVWDAASGLPITPPLDDLKYFSVDGGRIVTPRGPEVLIRDLHVEEASVTDLLLLSELFTGQQMDARGAVVQLDAEALGRSWQTLRKKAPRFFTVPLAQAFAWYRRQAEDCERADEWAAAIAHWERMFESQKKNLGIDHADTLGTESILRNRYFFVGNNEKAAPLYEQELQRKTQSKGEKHADTLLAMVDVGNVYSQLKRFTQAEMLFRKVLEGAKDRPEAYTVALLTEHSLGKMYMLAGKYDKAVALLEPALPKMKTKLEPDHPATLDTMIWLAASYLAAAQPDKAVPLLEQGLATMKGRNPEHRDTGDTMFSLARAYLEAGKLDRAQPLLRETLSRQRKKTGPTSSATANVLALMSLNLLKQHEYREAEAAARECLAIRAREDLDNWLTFNMRSMLGEALLGQKKHADAEPLLLEGYEGMKQREAKIPPQASIRLIEAVERLVRLYEATGQKGKVALWRKKLEEAKNQGGAK